ncbi:MAG: hypothetical protein HY928_03535 [Elusimicrobia bacterium]|nr:hypothetical protein [Elusimicrobiota bacterium]
MKTPIALVAAALLAPAAYAAPTLEGSAVAARGSYFAATSLPASAFRSAEFKGLTGVPLQKPPFQAVSAPQEGTRGIPLAKGTEVDLGALLNAHLKSQLTVTLGGKKSFIGGVFDRQQNAFLTVWVEGEAAPLVFNIKGLLDKAGTVVSGGAVYSLYLEANPLQPLKSKITFENKANEDDLQSVRLGKLLEAIEASGQALPLTGQSYRLFYYQDVQETASGASLNPNSRTFALILKEGEEMHVFLIPEETVPSDKMAVFKVYKDKRIGLQKDGKTLRVFEL